MASSQDSFDFESVAGYVRSIHAVAVALSHSLRVTNGGIAMLIYPGQQRLSWLRLEPAVQDRFTNICKDLGLTDEQLRIVRRHMFRNTPGEKV